MERKIFRSISILSMITSLVTALLIIILYNSYYESNIRNDLKNDIERIKKMELSNENTKLYNNRITLIDAEGNVIFDSKSNIAQMDNHIERPEIIEAVENGIGESTRISNTINLRTYYYAIRLDDGSILRIANTAASIYSIMLRLLPWIIIVIIFIYFMTFITANALTSKIIKPINAIDLNHPDNIKTYEELSPLVSQIHKQNIIIGKQIEELKSKQQEFNAITDNMSEGFIIIDSKTNILSYNKSAAALFHINKIGESILKYNRSDHLRNIVSTVLNGNDYDELIDFEMRKYQVISNTVGGGAIIFFIDVTEREDREKIRREFTANVSHELKTPLTSISGYAEIISNGIARESDVQKFAGKIYDESQRLIELINDIIKLSHLDEKNIGELYYEDVDIYATAEEIISQLQQQATVHNITVLLTGEHSIIRGIKQILYEIIYNLCDNAIKYNKENGYVNVIISDKSIVIEDSGIGIADEDSERVFERFYRGDKSHSKEISGTGLGLAIVKHGVLLHGGKILLESEIGKGTKVNVIFR